MLRAWFQHVFAAPVLPQAARAVRDWLERESRERTPAGEADRRDLVESARQAVARLLNACPDDVILTSGGTEAANLAIKGRARASPGRMVTCRAEHSSVLYPLRTLQREGLDLVQIPVNRWGQWNPEHVATELERGAALLSLQHANQELGTLQPVAELAALCRPEGAVVHMDAVASAGLARLDVTTLGVDLLSISGSRLGGVPGSGALWVRPGVRLLPQMEGGVQEGGRRGGSENLLGLAALAAACDHVAGREASRWRHTRQLRDRLEQGLLAAIPAMTVNSPAVDQRLPGHLHVSFPGAEGEALVYRLRGRGVEASTGSACSGPAGKPSHVLEAAGIPAPRSRCSLLFSLGPSSRAEEVDHALQVVPEVVEGLRRTAPAGTDALLDPPAGMA